MQLFFQGLFQKIMTKGWFKFKFLNILHSFEHHKYYNDLYFFTLIFYVIYIKMFTAM